MNSDPGTVPKTAARSIPLVSAAVLEQIQTTVVVLREDTRDEAALGDAASQTRNIAVSNAACALAELAEGKDEHRKLAVDAGGVEALVFALKRRPNSEAVQTKATITLGILVAGSAEYQTLAGEAGAIEAVASAMRGHPNSVTLLEHAVQSLGQLVADNHKTNQQLARRAGCVEAVITALQHHQGNEALQINASRALGRLVSSCCDNQLRASRAGGVEAVVGTIEAHRGHEALQECAIEALGLLVDGNRGNQTLGREAGAITVVVAALGEHSKSSAIQWRALCALRKLVADHKESQAVAGSSGGISAVLAALRCYSGRDEQVPEHACDVLHHLVSGSKENQVLAREAGLINVVIRQVLDNQRSSLAAQAKAAQAMGSLVYDHTESQTLAGEGGAVEALASLLQRHFDCEAVRENAAEALGRLAAKHSENQRLVRKVGAIDKIVEALRQPPTSAVARSKLSEALRSLLVANQLNTKVAVSAGWIEEVVLALQQREKPLPGPGLPGYDATSHQAYQKLAAGAGLIEAVGEGLKQQPKSVKLTKNGLINKMDLTPQLSLLAAIQDLVVLNYENQRLAADAGAVESVVQSLGLFMRSDSLVELVVRTLSALVADNAANQRRAKAAEAEEALSEAQKTHPESPLVQEATKTCIDHLFAGANFASRILETEYGQRHRTAVQIPDAAMRGVTLEQLTDLQDFMKDTLMKLDLVDSDGGKSVTWDELTMYQVREHFVLPLTVANRCSFVESVAQGKQPPMWMISHWWGTPFPFTVRMLELQARSRHLHGASAVTYWCDAFANNQHDLAEVQEVDVLKFPFARAMLSQTCIGTVLLVDPQVTLLLRTWCVFEAYITHQLRCGAMADRTDKKRYFLDILAPVLHRDPVFENQDKVTITMLQDAIGGSWNEVSDEDGVNFPLDIAHVGVGVDVCKSEADRSDKAAILNYLSMGVASKEPPVEEHPKYDELNAFVHMVFASAELYRVASERPSDALDSIAALLELRADVNSFVRKGNTALFAAAGADPTSPVAANDAVGQRELVEMLLQARADVNHANSEMKTVLDCASALSEDARGLLLEHGAKTFVDAAPELERSANAQLSQILFSGFASERQAFVGGDAGTKLGGAAQRSLQAAATKILKLYHWAPCRISVQTGSGKHQAHLASARGESVRYALECAGCKNSFTMTSGSQKSVLSLSVSLAPPRSLNPAPLLTGASALSADKNPRSPHGVLALRPNNLPAPVNGQSKLPPVTVGEGKAGGVVRYSRTTQRTFAGAGCDLFSREASPTANKSVAATRERLGRVAAVTNERSVPRMGPNGNASTALAMVSSNGAGPVPAGVSLENMMEHGWPQVSPNGGDNPAPGVTNGRPVTRNKIRQAAAQRRMAWSHSDSQLTGDKRSTALAHQTTSSNETPREEHVSPSGAGSPKSPKYRRGPVDLDNLAGERWLQTSITCSWSSPALSPAKGAVTDAPVATAASLQTAAPTAGLYQNMSASQDSGDPWASLGPEASQNAGERGRGSDSSSCGSRHASDRGDRRATEAKLDATATRPRAAFGNRQPQLQPGEGRPRTRGGQRQGAAGRGPNVQTAVNCSKSSPTLGLCGGQAFEPAPAQNTEAQIVRTHNLPSLAPLGPMQRGAGRNAAFSVADLLV